MKVRKNEVHLSDHSSSDLSLYDIRSVDVSTTSSLPIAQQKIAAGFPIPLAPESMNSSIDLNKELIAHPASTYLARVIGDSMIGAGVESGDLLVIDKAKMPTEQSLTVCCVDGEFTLKHVKKEGDNLFLIPENPKFKPIKVEDGSDFRVWGVVDYIIKKR